MTISWGMTYFNNIVFITLRSMVSNAFEKSIHSEVRGRFFARTPSKICLIVRSCPFGISSTGISSSPTAFSFEMIRVAFDRSSSANGSVFISRRLIISHSCSFSISFIVWLFFPSSSLQWFCQSFTRSSSSFAFILDLLDYFLPLMVFMVF